MKEVVKSDDNFETAYEVYEASAAKLLDVHCPEETRVIKRHNQPNWMDQEFKAIGGGQGSFFYVKLKLKYSLQGCQRFLRNVKIQLRSEDITV